MIITLPFKEDEIAPIKNVIEKIKFEHPYIKRFSLETKDRAVIVGVKCGVIGILCKTHQEIDFTFTTTINDETVNSKDLEKLIIDRIFNAIVFAIIHECQEQFIYDGKRIFNPHQSTDYKVNLELINKYIGYVESIS